LLAEKKDGELVIVIDILNIATIQLLVIVFLKISIFSFLTNLIEKEVKQIIFAIVYFKKLNKEQIFLL
jgi:hypothetical protein